MGGLWVGLGWVWFDVDEDEDNYEDDEDLDVKETFTTRSALNADEDLPDLLL